MPATNPCDRDHDRMSACNWASVCAVAVRPMGPAATDPSAPSVNLLSSSLSAPRSVMTSMIKSVDDPPIWKPTLPPSIRTVPGADQPAPLLLRQDRYPFPYFPPTTNAPVFRSGTIHPSPSFCYEYVRVPVRARV